MLPRLNDRHGLTGLEATKIETVAQWQRVLFSDESRFNANNHTGSSNVCKRIGEEWRPECLIISVKHPALVMVWGCMAGHGVGLLEKCEGMMNGEKYMSTLRRKLLSSALVLFPEQRLRWMFQDDNAPCHRSKMVKEWAKTQNFERIR